ncbi:hypothetical protein ANO11243_051330 [Dothideomycetidae sp. 11243]|nr:hypothetical protein ANO11243_051330 [fungal sp. No.11243]
MAGLLGKKFPTPIAAEYATHPANPAAGANAAKKTNGH